MPNDRPTGSISGRRNWQWNRRQDQEGDTSGPAHDSSGARTGERPSGATHQRQRSPTAAEGHGEDDVEAALRRKERQLQEIRERYERLLDERNRQLEEAKSAGDDSETGVLADLLGRLRER